MSISKNQLDAINSGVLDTIGDIDIPSLNDGRTLDQALFNIAELLVKELRESATKKGVVASKRLRSSIAPTPTTNGIDVVEVSIVMEDYWKDVEYGRKPGKPPKVQDIEDWITAKGIRFRKDRQGLKHKTILEARRSMAEKISAAIGKKGTIARFKYKGSGFIKEVMTKENVKKISEHLAELTGRKIQLYFSVK